MTEKKIQVLKKKFPTVDKKTLLEIYSLGASDGVKSQKIEIENLKMKLEKLKGRMEDDGK